MIVLSIPVFLLSLAASAWFGFFHLRNHVKRQGLKLLYAIIHSTWFGGNALR